VLILEINDITTLYAQSLVLDGVSLTVDKGEIVALLGRNGAGKTTTMRSIMGLTPPRSGSIKLIGMEISGKEPFEIAKLGIGYSPDESRIFANLSAEDNLLLAGRQRRQKDKVWTVEKIYQLFPALQPLRSSRGGRLSGGEQKMLAIGRALMKDPELLLLDEPSEGLAPLIVIALAKTIVEIRKAGVTIFMADQKLRFCRRVADRGYIMEKGIIRYQDEMRKIWQNEEVVRKYLVV
jgi:branched-chain amino acid transport system ATP-binding protein